MLSPLRLPFSPHGPPFPSSFLGEGNWRKQTKHGMVKRPLFGENVGNWVDCGKGEAESNDELDEEEITNAQKGERTTVHLNVFP